MIKIFNAQATCHPPGTKLDPPIGDGDEEHSMQ